MGKLVLDDTVTCGSLCSYSVPPETQSHADSVHSFCLASKTAKQWVSHCSLTKGSHFAAVGVEKLVMAEAGGTRWYCSHMKVARQGCFYEILPFQGRIGL